MATNILPISRGTLKVAAVNFYPFPSRANSTVIQLGAMAEISLPTLRGLGLIARTELTAFELEQLGEMGRRMLSAPFVMLNGEFDVAWKESAPGNALAFLRDKHHHSLRFESPNESALPGRLFVDGHAVRALVRDFINITLDELAGGLTPLHEGPITGKDLDTVAENTRLDPIALPAAA